MIHLPTPPLATAAQTPTLNQRCTCAEVIGDSDVERLHRLMGAGMSQRDSSLLLWSEAAAWRRALRSAFLTRWPDLRLPEVLS